MSPTRRQALKTLAGTSAAAAAATLAAPGAAWAVSGSARSQGTVLERDVCVIGGGSSGTYTAVRLRDLGSSVVLVEHKNRLGGHCETYTDPATGLSTDIGVEVFNDLPVVRDYFGRFGVPLVSFTEGSGPAPAYADFRSGKIVEAYAPPVPTALGTYFGILQQYPYLAAGYDLPDPVPAALLQPWGDFVAANGLDSIAQLAFQYAEGLNDLLRLPTLYVLKNFGLNVIESILTGGFLATPNHNSSALYEAASAFLGRDVLLGTSVVATQRDDQHGVQLLAATPQGPVTIRARKLVITIPTLPRTLAPFDLDAVELGLFSRFRQGNYYTALVRLPGVPDAMSVQNIGADTPYNIPPLPAAYSLLASHVPGLFNVKYASHTPLSDDVVRASMLESIVRLQATGTIPPTHPVFVDYSSHTPFELTVSAAEIAGGFYSSLYALQGRRSTYWNGAAFHDHNSALLWQFTERLIPAITGR